MRSSKVSTSKAEAAIRSQRALEMRALGHTYQQIGEALGVHQVTAHGIIKRRMAALNEKISESAEQVRQLELARLDDLFRRAMAAVEAGNVNAIDKALRVCESRRRLLGLDAPTRTDISSGGEPFLIQVVRYEPGTVQATAQAEQIAHDS